MDCAYNYYLRHTMKQVQRKLSKLDTYLHKIEINPETGNYEVFIATPYKWIIKENNSFGIKFLLDEEDQGKYFSIAPKVDEVEVDDILEFADKIISLNKNIEREEEELKKRIQEEKERLAKEVQDFYDKVENLDIEIENKKNTSKTKKQEVSEEEEVKTEE